MGIICLLRNLDVGRPLYLKEPLMVKGYYLMGCVGLISSSFTVSKVVRDNQEDEENYNKLIAQQTFEQ